jgi:pimeloyl-ACP methyl ester carboxylesterase
MLSTTDMKNLRKYGKSPFNIAVIHGGPGACGEMAPVAKELSSICGVLEPLQTTITIDGQILELYNILKKNGNIPVILVGYSWGAILSFIFTSRYPLLIKKIILVSSGSFEEKHAKNIMKTRLDRLSNEDKSELLKLMNNLKDPTLKDKNTYLNKFSKLISKADSYDPIKSDREELDCNFHVYQNVWNEAEELRHSGKLLKLGKKIKCPVTAIHGEYDPHPYKGIRSNLSHILTDFKFFLLTKCGHCPWIEKYARDKFYNIIKKEIEKEV